MNRRHFLRSAGAVSASVVFANASRPLADAAPSEDWRTFEVGTRVILKPSGVTRLWLPGALLSRTPYQRTLSNKFSAEGGTARIVEARTDGLGIIAAEFPAGVKPVLTLTSRVATWNYGVDLATSGGAPKAERSELEHFLRPTKLLRTDGIVKETAVEITTGAKPTSIRHARSMSGSSITPFGTRELAAAASAISALCWSPRIWVGNAPILTLSMSVWPVRPASRLATYMAYASQNRNSGIKASAPRRKTSPKRSTAGPKSISTITAGFRLIPLTCGKLYSRNCPEIGRYTTS